MPSRPGREPIGSVHIETADLKEYIIMDYLNGLVAILTIVCLAYELRRTLQNRDLEYVANQQLIDRLREEVENLKDEQKQQRWNDVGLAVVLLVIVLVQLFNK